MLYEIKNDIIISTLIIWLYRVHSFAENFIKIKELLYFFVFILAFLYFAFYFITKWQRDINKISQIKIDKLKNNGKYIEDIFIELNESKELLRYYLHGKKWRLNIINTYNSLFNLYVGKHVVENINNKVKFSIPFYTRLKKIKIYIEKTITFFENMRKNKKSIFFKEDTGDLSHYAWSLFYGYDKLLKNILYKIEMCNNNYVLTLGNAGNGKTNLLCSFSETVMKYGQPCVFIDAKEIKEDIEEFLIKIFNIPNIFNFKMNLGVFLKIYSLFLFLKRKYLFVIIDALNENDIEGFHDTFKLFFNKLGNFGRIKILVSCRSEYFNERFEKIFNEIDIQFTKIKINQGKYNKRAKEKTLINYQKYFNVKGTIIDSAKDKLFTSLLLMRIFFEVNKDKDVNTLELRNAEIYKQYIKQISEKYQERNSSIKFQEILNRITKLMLDSNLFDGVLICNLELTNEELEIFKSMLDENLIINKKIKEGTGITERENEIIYFVFDELRDFCISRKILIDCEKQEKIDYRELFEFLYKLNKNKLSPLEGVLKYSYYYLKNDSKNPSRLIFCKKLLVEFGDVIKYDFLDYQKNIFSNFGILMILADSTYIEEFELEYLIKSMRLSRDFWNILNILLNNEFTGCGLTIKTFLFIILRYTINSIRNIIFNMTRKEEYYLTSDSNELDDFCSKILHQDIISNEIKWILIIMNEVNKGNKQIENCIKKFNIGENEKNDFINWLSINKYKHSYINEISKLIHIGGNTL